MNATTLDYTATQLLAAVVGIALVLFGRRLYWLALGGVGFFIGLSLAGRYIDVAASWMQLGLGFLVGVLGALLATAAQRVAVALGGFAIGGYLGYWIPVRFLEALDRPPEPWLWILAVFGAMIGTVFASMLFEVALIALTSLLGALLVAKSSQLPTPLDAWLFLLLVFVGMVIQSSARGRRRDSEGRSRPG